MENEELTFNLPDPKTIPCATCKYGRINYLASNCFKFKLKPKDVYYENAKCPHYEKIDIDKL